MTTPTIGQYRNMDKYYAPQWLGDRAKRRCHVMVKAAARALARCGPSHLVDSLVRSARAGAIVGLLATVTTGVTAASDSRGERAERDFDQHAGKS